MPAWAEHTAKKPSKRDERQGTNRLRVRGIRVENIRWRVANRSLGVASTGLADCEGLIRRKVMAKQSFIAYGHSSSALRRIDRMREAERRGGADIRGAIGGVPRVGHRKDREIQRIKERGNARVTELALIDTQLFVYGTLAPGRANEHQLDRLEGTWVRQGFEAIFLKRVGALRRFPWNQVRQ